MKKTEKNVTEYRNNLVTMTVVETADKKEIEVNLATKATFIKFVGQEIFQLYEVISQLRNHIIIGENNENRYQ